MSGQWLPKRFLHFEHETGSNSKARFALSEVPINNDLFFPPRQKRNRSFTILKNEENVLNLIFFFFFFRFFLSMRIFLLG